MKKLLIITLLAFSGLLSYGQDDAAIPNSKKDIQSIELPKSTLFLNPLGILQFGPILGSEHRLGSSNSYLSPHVRWVFLGLLTHTSWNATYISPLSAGVGLSYRNIQSTTNGNAFYFGGGLELEKTHARYDDFGTEEYYTGISLIFNAGYRFRFDSGRFINIGGYAGSASTLSDDEYYIDTGELYSSYTDTFFIGMLELAFGFEKK